VNGTWTVNGDTYRVNKDLGGYLEVWLHGNWTKLNDNCYTSTHKVFVGAGCILPDTCTALQWVLEGEGDGCDSPYIPDVFFLSLILFLGTFGLAMFCRNFRSTGYFPSWVSASYEYDTIQEFKN